MAQRSLGHHWSVTFGCFGFGIFRQGCSTQTRQRPHVVKRKPIPRAESTNVPSNRNILIRKHPHRHPHRDILTDILTDTFTNILTDILILTHKNIVLEISSQTHPRKSKLNHPRGAQVGDVTRPLHGLFGFDSGRCCFVQTGAWESF